MHRPDINKFKVAMVGPMGVGKTSIVTRMEKCKFEGQCDSTVGCAFHSFKIGDKRFEIWDTAGQERFMSIGPMYYRNARILIFVFDLNDPKSFELMLDYLDYFFTKVGNYDANVDFIIVGNKTDLEHLDESHWVTQYQSNSRIQNHNLQHLIPLFVSAKTGNNIGQIIAAMSRSVVIEELAEKPLALEEQPTPPETTGCYC